MTVPRRSRPTRPQRRLRSVATKEECATALDRLAQKMSGIDSAERSKNLLERSVSCEIPDLKVTFHGQLKDARLMNVRSSPVPEPVPTAPLRTAQPREAPRTFSRRLLYRS